jgi:hypothetical protein
MRAVIASVAAVICATVGLVLASAGSAHVVNCAVNAIGGFVRCHSNMFDNNIWYKAVTGTASRPYGEQQTDGHGSYTLPGLFNDYSDHRDDRAFNPTNTNIDNCMNDPPPPWGNGSCRTNVGTNYAGSYAAWHN